MSTSTYRTITLNVSPHISEQEWARVIEVYRSMDGWIEGAKLPSWYGLEDNPPCITASAEPGGLLFDAEDIDPELWTGWLTVICAKLTLALGTAIHDAGMQ